MERGSDSAREVNERANALVAIYQHSSRESPLSTDFPMFI